MIFYVINLVMGPKEKCSRRTRLDKDPSTKRIRYSQKFNACEPHTMHMETMYLPFSDTSMFELVSILQYV